MGETRTAHDIWAIHHVSAFARVNLTVTSSNVRAKLYGLCIFEYFTVQMVDFNIKLENDEINLYYSFNQLWR